MRIGIMGAIPEEVDLIRSEMKVREIVTVARRDYYSGELHGSEVVLVFSHSGKVASASTVTTLFNLFDVDFLLFVGLAGGVHPALNVGDIVIGERLYQHDMDRRPLFPKFQIPLTERDYFSPHEIHLVCAENAINHFLKEIEEHIAPNVLAEFFMESPKVVRGTIATGDQFISNPELHDNLIFKGEIAHAVEMEGASVAQICHEYNKPYLIIRTISDKVDQTASIDFKKFRESASNFFSRGIIRKLLPDLMKVLKDYV
ncbi:MAG: 5'-methylthioadenosine/adenosylhomocysteine nucleosidase [Chthoniobacterales bacterium]